MPLINRKKPSKQAVLALGPDYEVNEDNKWDLDWDALKRALNKKTRVNLLL